MIDRSISLVIFLGACVWRLANIYDFTGLIREMGHLLLILLLGYSASVHPWYVTWVLPVAALTETTRLRQTLLLFCGTSLVLYTFPAALVEQGRFHTLWATVRIAAAFVPPIAFWVLRGMEARRQVKVTVRLRSAKQAL